MANKLSFIRLKLPILRSKSINNNSSSSANACPNSPSSSSSPPHNNVESTAVAATRDPDRQQLWPVFCYFDHNNDGKISAEELRAYFKSVGDSISEEEAVNVIKEFDGDGDNLLEFNDFVQLIMRKDSKDTGREDQDNMNIIKKAFEMYEVDKGSGCITPKGLQMVLNRLGGSKSLDECKAMIRVFDLDGNGVLDFDEFHKMMS